MNIYKAEARVHGYFQSVFKMLRPGRIANLNLILTLNPFNGKGVVLPHEVFRLDTVRLSAVSQRRGSPGYAERAGIGDQQRSASGCQD